MALLLPAAASAEDGGRTLFLARELDESEARALGEAVASVLDTELVTPEGSRRELERSAHGVRERAATRRGTVARARSAYVHLRLGTARGLYDRAIEATLADPVAAPSPEQVAQLLFERALVALAARRDDDATADLRAALLIHPALDPDRDVYGPPVFRALEQARRFNARAPSASVRVDRAPRGAEVTVSGRPVAPGEVATVPRLERHLLIAGRPGYEPRAEWVELDGDPAELSVVLRRADGAVLAAQALDVLGRWRGGTALTDEGVAALARALGAGQAVLARGAGEEVHLSLVDAEGEHVVREATGARVAWELEPWSVLASALAGRVVPPPSASDVAISATAPSLVTTDDAIRLDARVVDPTRRVRSVLGRCSHAEQALELAAAARHVVGIELAAPAEPTTVRCSVLVLDERERVLSRAPSAEGMRIDVVEPTPWYGQWYVWGAVGAAAAAVATVLIVNAATADPQNVIVVGGPP